MKDVGKFYGHSVYITAILYTLWPLGIFCGHFGIFFPFWYVAKRKIWQPCFTAVTDLQIGSRRIFLRKFYFPSPPKSEIRAGEQGCQMV
jgi:hypothetical protein